MTWYAHYQTQAELDADYDVERSVPDFMVYANRFVAQSEAVRQRRDPQRQVPYGPTVMEWSNVYPSRGGDPAPVMIYVHGGCWCSLTADVFDFVVEGAVSAGFAVVNVTYDLCPKVTMAEIVRQVRAAVAWIWRNAADFGGDPARIHLVGHSAGAHLAAMACLTDWENEYGLPADIVKSYLGISGIYDLEPMSLSFAQPTLRLTVDEVRRQSPVNVVRSCPVPMDLVWGEGEGAAFGIQARSGSVAKLGMCGSTGLPAWLQAV